MISVSQMLPHHSRVIRSPPPSNQLIFSKLSQCHSIAKSVISESYPVWSELRVSHVSPHEQVTIQVSMLQSCWHRRNPK